MTLSQLISQLQQTKDWELQSALIPEIAAFGAEAIPPLIETLALFPDPDNYFSDNSNANLHSIAENILMLIGKPTVEVLIPLLQSKNWGMRHGAIWVLDHLHDVRAIEPMIAALDTPNCNEQGCGVHHEIMDALRNYGEFALEPLIEALHHQNADIRANAALTLRDFDDPRLPQLLIQLAEHDPAPFVRSQAAFALGNFSDEAVAQTLIYLTGDSIQEVRINAIIALQYFADEPVTQVLMSLTQDTDSEISEVARDTLTEREKKSNDE